MDSLLTISHSKKHGDGCPESFCRLIISTEWVCRFISMSRPDVPRHAYCRYSRSSLMRNREYPWGIKIRKFRNFQRLNPRPKTLCHFLQSCICITQRACTSYFRFIILHFYHRQMCAFFPFVYFVTQYSDQASFASLAWKGNIRLITSV